MGARIEIWPEGISTQDGHVQTQAAIEIPSRERLTLWFRVPEAHAEAVAETSEPFLLALLFTSMERGEPVCVHGRVAPSLLRNLDDLQAVWHAWCPDRYTPVDVAVDEEAEPPWVATPRGVLTGFSGGADSSFTVWRHRPGQTGPGARALDAAMMVHGFDIPIDEEDGFRRAAARAKETLDSVGLPLITVATNLRALGQRWPHSWALSLVTCFMLFQRAYSTGIIADECSADWEGPCPAGLRTDGPMSCDAFEVITDGWLVSRVDKLRAIAQWPEALRHLRVCYQDKRYDRNCGRCGKCMRTMLAFRVLGLPLPPCFERDVTVRDILRNCRMRPESVYLMGHVLAAARRTAPGARWVRALGYALLRSRIRLARKAAFRELRHLASEAFALLRPKRPNAPKERNPQET